MNLFLNLFFIFLLVFALFGLLLRTTDKSHTKLCGNFIVNKFILFIFIFCFQFLMILISKALKKCKIVMSDLISDSLQTSITTVLGYSIILDLYFMKSTRFIPEKTILGKRMGNFYLSFFIVLFVAMIKMVTLIFSYQQTDCIKYNI